ncbi:MAG: hypothetical protein M5U27_09475 [Gaiella sp.]|nr:hypothetical protein [Gaiella sp.]
MTVRALLGLVVLHAGFLGAGTAVLFALGGLGYRREAVRLAGLSYLLGISVLGIAWTCLLAAGVPFGLVTVVVTIGLAAAAGVVVGRGRGLALADGAPIVARRALLVGAAGVALVGLYLEVLFRSARLEGLYSFDGWAFWVPRGKAIYYAGGFDPDVFAAVPHASYPPVVPILDAAAFHAMGSADVVTLHVQYWLFALGFLAAVAGLLVRRVPAWILWPSVALVLVLPRMRASLLAAQADYLLDYLVVTAAILLLLWLSERRPWQLHAAALLLACGAIVKREGLVLAGCVLAGAAVASWRSRRWAWPRLAAVAAVAAVATVPWQLWYRAHGIRGELGSGGSHELFSRRTLDSLRLAVDVLAGSGRWSVVPTIGLVAVVLAAVWGRRSHAAFAGVAVGLLTLAGASTSVVFPDIGVTADEAVNPIVRLTGGTVLLVACLTPLLLAGVWAGRSARYES